MTLAEELTSEAWERFTRWEKRMLARFSECFEDVGLMERVDIYAKQTLIVVSVATPFSDKREQICLK